VFDDRFAEEVAEFAVTGSARDAAALHGPGQSGERECSRDVSVRMQLHGRNRDVG
jgi:hypothetical protein